MEADKKILIVEDESPVARELKLSLEDCGYRVCGIASAGSEALEMAEKYTPDLIIIDIVLNDTVDGITTVEAIHERFDIPVIYLTAHPDEKTRERAKKTEPYGYILKPVQDSELRSMIDMALLRHDAEKRLRQSENKYKQVVENASDFIFTTDVLGNYQFVNAAGLRMTGYSLDEILKMNCLDMVPPEFRRRLQIHYMRQYLKRKQKSYVEYPFRVKDGSIIWLGQNNNLIIQDDEVVGFHFITRDITERRQAEERLRRSEDLLRKVIDNIPAAIFAKDRESQILVANKTVADFYNLSLDEVVGRKQVELHRQFGAEPEEVEKWLMDDLRVIESGKPEHIIEKGTDSQNRVHWFETNKIPLDIGKNQQGVLVLSVDVTDRKTAEDELRKSEERFREVSNLTSDYAYAYRVEPDGELVNEWVTGALEKITGFTAKEIHDAGGWESLIYEGDMPIPMAQLKLLLANESSKVEYRIVNKKGKVRWMLDYARPVFDEKEGRVVHIYGAVQDITERKLGEQRIQKELKEKEVLLKEIHHRVKNNMNVITSLLSLQSQKIKNKDQALAAFKESRDRIYSMALVHEQLYMSKDLSKIDMKPYIETISLKLQHAHASEKDVALDLIVKNVLLDINHAVPCGLILNELITNAYQHAFKGRKEGNIKISFRLLKDKAYRLIVQDDGVGLPEKIDIGKSETLGLQLIRILVDQINGELKIKRDKGTTFTILFSVEDE